MNKPEIMNKIPLKIPYMLYGIMAVAAIAAITMGIYRLRNTAKDGDGEETAYSYDSYVEAKLADDVKCYIGQYVTLSDADKNTIADYSVQNYRTVLSSDISEATYEHSEALNEKEKAKLREYIPEEQVSGSDLEALASGINRYVWEAVLLTIGDSQEIKEEYPDEYKKLAESIQAQIDDLENKSLNLHITARVKDSDPGTSEDEINEMKDYLYGGYYDMINEEVDSKIDGMMGEFSDELSAELLDEISQKLKKEMTNEMTNELTSELTDTLTDTLTENLTEKLKDEIKDGDDGKDGSDGKDGKDGSDGKDGKDGSDGSNGKSTYIAYAEDGRGSGFSLTPTDKSKYIGTCITDEPEQPKTASSYGNWQIYRTYIISSAQDDEGTVLYIN
jgi:hypothetical protein